MRLSLFIPCFVDHYYPQVGVAVLSVLESLGHDVHFPERQTCCGQPAFNSGYWDQARPVAAHMLDVFADAEAVVAGSCGAMVKVFNAELFEGTDRHADALALAAKTWEFSDFLVNKLGVGDVGARYAGKVTFHDGCHGLRELGLKKQARHLLSFVRDLELVEMGEAETCCGFGGTFSAKFPEISCAMGEVKCQSILETGADAVVSNDMSCLMQIGGLLSRSGKPLPMLHLAELLVSR